ncbi:chemotaxis protein CheB [Pannonibacter tanglangensis]|uniref:protein-glutamate methylesterase n=1 Tax=Pannonibacter tanglangensis TaxID=2750084 RepID=A0ABW9ZL13_9HYPH|nr:hypothetical protein [Pannonibacter sp. XCT-34]
MKRPILIAAPGAFERSGLRRILAEAFPAAELRDCATPTDLLQALEARFAGLVVVDEALLQVPGAAALLGRAMDRLDRRLIRLARDPATPGPPIGSWARDLPERLRSALAAQAGPGAAPARPPVSPPVISPPINPQPVTSQPAVSRTADPDAHAAPVTPDGLPGRLAARPRPGIAAVGPAASPRSLSPRCLLVASSTGGPGALGALLAATTGGGLPWIIAQHMPSHGTAAFAAHLADVTGRTVREVSDRSGVAAGDILVLRGGQDFELLAEADGGLLLRPAAPADSPFHPNADGLMLSAAARGIPAAALVLSGMGEDGAVGAAALAAAGGPVFVQAPATCVVAGMPGAALARLPLAPQLDPAAPSLAFLRLCSHRP